MAAGAFDRSGARTVGSGAAGGVREILECRQGVDLTDGGDEVQQGGGAVAELAQEGADGAAAGGGIGVDAVGGEEGLVDAAEVCGRGRGVGGGPPP